MLNKIYKNTTVLTQIISVVSVAAGASHVTHGHPSPSHLVVGGQYAGPPTSIPSLMITAPPLQHLHHTHTHTNGQTISHHITQVTRVAVGF
jgi:hypothetical protein